MALKELMLDKHLEDLLEGRVTPEKADPRILLWAQFMIHKRADQVLALPTKEARRAELDTIPETIRPYVEREAKSLFTLRQGRAKG